MPTFKNRKTLGLPGGLELSISVEAGLVRTGKAGAPGGRAAVRDAAAGGARKLGRAGRRLADKGRELLGARAAPASADDGVVVRGLDPAKMVWIFGSGRSGSTWLRSMMGELPDHRVWEEPMVGLLFGRFYDNAQKGQLGSANFIMSNPTRRGWIRSLRNFTLDGARYAHPRLRPQDHLVVKEPNGSVGAPLLMEAIPESRMVLLIRDPRDVVASTLDAAKEGSWMYERKSGGAWKENSVADRNPDKFVQMRAKTYLRDAGAAARAYREHRGPKTLVRYEELVEDTPATMRRIYSDLGLTVDREELARSVEQHSWANIPEGEKGEGKFYRKGQPGSWREDLTPEQIQIVQETTAPLLREFYPDTEDPGHRAPSTPG